MQESLQSVFLDVFSLPDHNSELYFFKKGLVQALGNLSTFAVQHCTSVMSNSTYYVPHYCPQVLSLRLRPPPYKSLLVLNEAIT